MTLKFVISNVRIRTYVLPLTGLLLCNANHSSISFTNSPPPFDYTRCTHIRRCTLHYRPTRSNRETRAASTLYIRGRFSRAWAALMTNRFSTLCMSELANHAQYCSRALQGRIIIDARIYVCVWREVSLARARACVQGFSFFFSYRGERNCVRGVIRG